MRYPTRYLVLLLVALLFTAAGPRAVRAADDPQPIEIAAVKHDGPVDFQKEILPILRQKCLACHNANDAESDLVLETPQTIRKGGFAGPAVVPGNSDKSLLLAVSSFRGEPFMPPEDNDRGAKPLTPQELGLIKLWIDSGAEGEVTAGGPVDWQPLPPGMNPIYSAAITDDGHYTAVSRANQIFVYHVPTGRLATRLTDPELLKTGIYKRGVAHLDMVQSLAFDPQGEVLASGGFRNVKLWRRPQNVRAQQFAVEESTAFALSDDRKQFATGGADGTIKLWDLASGKVVKQLTGHKGAVAGLDFSADGAMLLSGGADKTVRSWKLPEGTETAQIETPTEVVGVAIVNAGAQVVSAGSDKILRVWDPPAKVAADLAKAAEEAKAAAEKEAKEGEAKEGEAKEPVAAEPPKPLRELTGHGGPITALRVVPSAPHQVISASEDGTLRHWDVNTGSAIRSFSHGGPVTAIATTQDGTQFATASTNKTAKLWNAANGQQIAELKGDYRNDRRIAAGQREIALAKAEVADRKKLHEEAKKRVTSEEEGVKKANETKAASEKELAEKVEAAKKPAADKMAADKAAADAQAELEKAASEKTAAEQAVKQAADALAKAEEALKQATAAADKDKENKDLAAKRDQAQKARDAAQTAKTEADNKAKQATTAHQTAEKKQQDTAKKAEDAGKKAREAELEVQKAETVKNASTKAAEVAAKALEDAKANVPVTEKAIATAEAEQAAVEAELKKAQDAQPGLEQPLFGAAFSADGKLLAIGSANHQIHLYETKAGQPVDVLAGHEGPIARLAFLDATRLLSTAGDKQLMVWDTNPDWKLERTIGNVDDPAQLVDRVTALAFSRDGQLLATGSGEPSRSGELKVWKVADGSLVREVKDAHSDTVFGVAFSRNGELLASGSADRFMKVHRVSDGSFVRAFEGHSHHVLGVAWQADGKTLASAGADAVIKVWDFRAGEQKRTVTGAKKEITQVEFVGISDEFLATAGDQSVRRVQAGNGRNVRSYGGAQGFVYAADVTDDGQLIVAGGQDSVLRVYKTDNGEQIAAFEPPQPEPTADTVSTAEE